MKLTVFTPTKLMLFLAAAQICLCVPGQAIERRDTEGALARVQRVYVEQLSGPDASDQMRDVLMAALQNSGLFLLTENPERADATIRGSAGDVTFTEEHHTSDTLGAHLQTGITQNSKSRGYSGAGLSDNESTSSKERKHEASASIRIVAGNGDVIWSTTQESGGGRFRGAMADVADKIVRKLSEDMAKARKQAASSPEKQ